MSKKQKQIAMIAGAAVALYLVYRWYQNQQASSTTAASTTGTTAPDTSSSDYASLAGQEQSDVAALQGQDTTLAGQEQSDVSALNATLTAQGAQEQTDVGGLQGLINGLIAQIAAIPAGVAGPAGPPGPAGTPAHASGQKKTSRTKVKKPAKPKVSTRRPAAHPSAPRNTSVAHPNPNHAQRGNTHTPARPRLPQPKKPAPRTATHASGRRK